MQEEVELRRKRMDEYFASLDISKLTGEQQATISDFQNAVQEIREGMQDGPPSPELRESFRQVMELRDEVQDILLQELGSRLGTDATELSEGVQEVLSIMGAADLTALHDDGVFHHRILADLHPPEDDGVVGGENGAVAAFARLRSDSNAVSAR